MKERHTMIKAAIDKILELKNQDTDSKVKV